MFLLIFNAVLATYIPHTYLKKHRNLSHEQPLKLFTKESDSLSYIHFMWHFKKTPFGKVVKMGPSHIRVARFNYWDLVSHSLVPRDAAREDLST